MSSYVISISREYGSGGRLIGKQLAQRLGIPCYDRTIIQKAAEKSGLSPDFIARAGERLRGRFRLPLSPGGGNPAFSDQSVPASQQAFFAQSEVILELADQGPCVIVGRCSDYVLGGRPGCLKVFLRADLDSRIRRCLEDYHLPPAGVEQRIRQTDRDRSSYYAHYTGQTWGDMRNFDLTLNTAVTGVDGAVEVIAALVRASIGREDPA